MRLTVRLLGCELLDVEVSLTSTDDEHDVPAEQPFGFTPTTD